VTAVALGAFGADGASAHRSRYCGHSAANGTYWHTFYQGYHNNYAGRYGSNYGVYNHYHETAHYKSNDPNGLFTFRHNGVPLCRVMLGPVRVPVTGVSTVNANPINDPVGCVIYVQTGGPVFAWVGPDTGCPQDVFWYEPGPPTEDSSTDNDDIGCVLCIGATATSTSVPSASAPTDAGPVPLHEDQPLEAVRALRALGLQVDVYSLTRTRKGNVENPVREPRASDGCVVGVYTREFGPIDPENVPTHVAMEVAGKSLARSVGHGC
jgi:hypothetical protein